LPKQNLHMILSASPLNFGSAKAIANLRMLLVLTLLGVSYVSFAQKNGYKEVLIGSNIENVIAQTNYRFSISNKSKYDYYAEIDSALICNLPIDHLKITVDDKKNITEVYVYTTRDTLPDYNAFSDRLKRVLYTIKDTLGAAVYSNISTGETQLLTVWQFKDTNTTLSVRVNDVSTFAKDIQEAYLFIWQADKSAEKASKMW
jgi:hypothetical protein